MRKLLLTTLILALSGCATTGDTERNKKVAWVVVGVVVAGAVLANSDSGSGNGENCYISVTASGSDQVCR